MLQARQEPEQKATRYRRLAREVADPQTVERILALVREQEARANRSIPANAFCAPRPGAGLAQSNPLRPRPVRPRSTRRIRLRAPCSRPRSARLPEYNRLQARADGGIQHHRELDKL